MSMVSYFAPSKLLSINISNIQATENWTVSDPNDPWVGNPYRWAVSFDVTPQTHSAYTTPTPFYYDGRDVAVGDWMSDIISGIAVQIIAITAQTSSSVSVIVEDIDRYNTFTDPSGNGQGIGSLGQGFLFVLGDDGLPILTPMTPLAATLGQNLAWQLDQISRFRHRNLLHSFYRVLQPDHGLIQGDPIVLMTNGNYAKADPTIASVVAVIGQVTSSGLPGPDYFSFRPVGRVVKNLSPNLPGQPGELIFLSASGFTTTAPSAYARPVFIQIDSTSAVCLDRGVQTPADVGGYISKISVVPNSAAVATLASPLPGDQVLVEDAGTGEWVHMIRHSDQVWRTLVTQDASHVDAETLEATVTGGASATMSMGSISNARVVTTVTVTVTAPFNVGDTLTVGVTGQPAVLMTADLADLSQLGTYTVNPSFATSQPETVVTYSVAVASSNSGSAVIKVSYS